MINIIFIIINLFHIKYVMDYLIWLFNSSLWNTSSRALYKNNREQQNFFLQCVRQSTIYREKRLHVCHPGNRDLLAILLHSGLLASACVYSTSLTMTNVFFSPRAYCKIILHATKYPHCAINGLLLGKQKSKDGRTDLYIEDAIPLFHICLHVSPMAEIALTLVNISRAFTIAETFRKITRVIVFL